MPHTVSATEHDILDVLIIGAGLSGIGAAWQLRKQCPGKRFAILEARDAIGGTWDLFRYPGIRSDSDMYTLGYRFRPWTNPKAIADGPSIRAYIRETAEEGGITPHIRFRQKAVSAAWSSSEACWSVVVDKADSGERGIVKARFLYSCSGYYSYDEAYRPLFDGEADFGGTLVVPQFWPEGLDYAGKRVVVIGSGATAVTVVPSMAEKAAHVTMLQRSPSYVVTRPAEDRIAHGLRRILPEQAAYALTRWKNVFVGMFFYKLARSRPEPVKQHIVRMAARQLGRDADVDAATHFTPNYKPWDQRVCAVPDGDLFRAIRKGQASVVTDTIDRFTAGGIRLASGKELPADIVVVATGLKLNVMGGMTLTVDGRPVEPNAHMAYKGMMLSDVPNLAMAFGYTNASWTLKADLTAEYVCRLLRYMDRHGKPIAVPRREPGVEPVPFLSFTSGYVQRAQHLLPQQGARAPWQVYQNYLKDLLTIRFGRIADGVMRFGAKGALP
ncbi:flavin-containing monooxygenase [Noviherbaspirillum aerium]|uniref:flavin-containing monooxygenase n=1 Tax=Noviherbaspirillum aerium TaxID=2588497 RepID=UPI00124E0128|nr:NAD(P)/FAD-dependent oxidoreductase [Noviherbaspirillum aerium]